MNYFRRKKVARLLMGLIVALAAALAVLPAWAYQGIGNSPYAAELLVSGLNTGSLDPGQEYWYAYSRTDLGDPSYNGIILSLNFEAAGVAVANRVNLQVFSFEQVEAWLRDNSGPVDSLGLGAPASADFDASTGERLWSGAIARDEVYYVRIFNLSPSPIQFRLTAVGQKNSGFEGFLDVQPGAQPAANPVIPASVSVPGRATQPGDDSSIAEALPAQPDDGSPASTRWLLAAQAIHGLPPQEAAAWLMSAAMLGWLGNEGPAAAPASAPAAVPDNPNPLQPVTVTDDEEGPEQVAAVPAPPEPAPEPDPYSGQSIYPNHPLRLLDGPNTGRMAPKSEHWYSFTPAKLNDKWIENYSLTMFFTPGEPNLARHVTFEMFTASQYPIWERGTPDDMEHFGAGSWVSRDGDYITGERLWHGTVVEGDQYFVKISNETGKWVDYHLVPGDVINTELGEPPVKPVKAIPAKLVEPTGADIGAPLALSLGRQTGQLAAGQDLWFSLKTPHEELDAFEFEPYLMELTHRPGHGTVANGVNVEIYPFQEQQIWRRGDGDDIKPLGVGGYTEYDKETDAHTWVWDGHLVSNTIYFVRIKNGSPQSIDYDLLIRQR